MENILKLLRDLLGIRPLVAILLILLAGYLFKVVRDYPTRELLYDRWYLLAVLAIISGSLALFIYTSGLAERTPGGRFGIYISRFVGDQDRSLHTHLTEALKANLAAKAGDAGTRIEVRDLKREMKDQELDQLPEMGQKLNAVAIIWGTAVGSSTVYLRLWSEAGGMIRWSHSLNITDISRVAEFTSVVWEKIEWVRQRRRDVMKAEVESKFSEELTRLRTEVDELR